MYFANVVLLVFLGLFACEVLAPRSLGSRLFRFAASSVAIAAVRCVRIFAQLLLVLISALIKLIEGVLALTEKRRCSDER